MGDTPRPAARFLDRSTPPHIVTLVLITGLAAMQMNILLPSLPAMAEYFQTDYALIQLLLSGYLAMTAVLQIIFGALSDRFGRRPVVLFGTMAFIVFTLVAATATSIEVLLAARFAQATVVTGYALSRAIVRDMVPLEEAASMIGYVTMGMALVPMLAPLVGGLLEELVGWRGSFYVSAALGLVTLIVVWFDLSETNMNRTETVGAQFRSYPALLSSRRFWGFTATSMFSAGTFFAFLGGGPYVARYHLGMQPSEFGLYFAFLPFGYIAGNFLSGRYATKMGIFPLMKLGTAVQAIGVVLAWLLIEFGFLRPIFVFAPLFFVGLGNGLTLPSAMAGMVSVRKHLAGSAAGLGGALNVGGGAALSVLAGFLLTRTSGPLPLVLLMLAAALLAVAAVYLTERMPNRFEAVEV